MIKGHRPLIVPEEPGFTPSRQFKGNEVGYLVGASGFEPPTSWSRTRRSSQAEPRPDSGGNWRVVLICRAFFLNQPGLWIRRILELRTAMHTEYIEQRNGGYYVAGTRISLDSVVYAFNEGKSPEAIQEDFPLLKRAQVYGAIAFYLDHQQEIDEYLAQGEREFEANTMPLELANPALWKRLQRARAKMGEPRA